MVKIKYNGKEIKGEWASKESAQDFILEAVTNPSRYAMYVLPEEEQREMFKKYKNKWTDKVAFRVVDFQIVTEETAIEEDKWEIKKVVYKTNTYVPGNPDDAYSVGISTKPVIKLTYRILLNDEIVGEAKTEKKAKEKMAYLKAHLNEIYE